MVTQVTLGSGAVSSAGSLKLQTNGTTDAVTFDTAQNMGLGVTPSTWTVYKAFSIAGTGQGIASSAGGETHLLANAYYNSGWKYAATQGAARFAMGEGYNDFRWYTAPSGTAGNPVSFTQTMTLDASGNLGVGTSSPTDSYGFTRALDLNGSGGAFIYLRTNGSTTNTSGIGNSGTDLYIKNNAAGNIRFFNNTEATERARIDSSGNLLVGTTDASATSGVGSKFLSSGRIFVVTPSSTDTYNYYNSTAGAYRFYVNAAGTIFATSTTISAISDERLKENIRDLDTGISTVMSLKPRRFDWKEGKGQDKKNAVGFIAQEFETVFPDSVATSKAGEDGIEYKNICHEELIPTLTKAIQELAQASVEQQAIIQQLQADVAALKA